MQPDDEVCLCFHVTKRKILNHLRVHRPRVPSQLSACAGAGTGCGWCIPFLKKYFEQSRQNLAAEADAISARDYARGRGLYLREGKGVAAPGATPPPEDDLGASDPGAADSGAADSGPVDPDPVDPGPIEGGT